MQHLITCHSWYKHLPLFQGGEFIFFLAPDAGEKYPTQHPRLPTENTPAGYRLAFGHLDYIYRTHHGEPFARDGGVAPEMEDELRRLGTCTLYPYLAVEFYWSVHELDVIRIRNGEFHPHAGAILNAYDADQRMEESWNQLSDADQETLSGSEVVISLLPDHLARHQELEETANKKYLALHESQVKTVRECVFRVTTA